MAKKVKAYSEPKLGARVPARAPGDRGELQPMFSVSSYTLNEVSDGQSASVPFPGNISPEGYFYSPFHEIAIKELDDVVQEAYTKRINFIPSADTTWVYSATTTFYDPEMGVFDDRAMWFVNVASPVSYSFIAGQPFCIYDVQDEVTYMGTLNGFSSATNGGSLIEIAVPNEIDGDGLRGDAAGASGLSRYMVSLVEENVPGYAEYIPYSGKLVWRGPKKMSDLSSDSQLYNMPFVNGRLYVHHNVNVFLRRQDPHGEHKLFHPSKSNPLKKYQIEGDAKLDLDYIQFIIDSMVDVC